MQTERATLPAEELGGVEIDDAALAAEVEAEEARGDQQLRKLGFTDEEIARVRGRTPETLAKPPMTLRDVERELGEIDRMRRQDKPAYFKNEAVQQRELDLLELKEKLKAGKPATGKAAPTETATPTDKKADETIDPDDLPLPESLKEQWRKSGPLGIEDALNAIRSRTGTILASLGEEESEGLLRSFDDDLPEEAQAAVAGVLAEDAGKWPVASETEVEEFRAVGAYGEELLQEWGREAPKLLGRARREAETMLSMMSAPARARTEQWIARLSAAQKAAVIRALATRPTRRL